MDKYYTQTIGTPVLAISGTVAGRIAEIVIDPETGKVLGFLLAPKGREVIAPNDIIFWEQNIFIHDEEDILETHEIIKVRDVLRKNIPIMRAKVFTKSGKYLGKVYDIGINPKFFMMTKLAVAKNVLGLFPYDEKLIAHGDILEITKERIIVKEVEARVRAAEKSAEAKEKLQIDTAPSTFKDL